MRLTPFRTAVSAAVLFGLGLACAPLIAQETAELPAKPRTADEIYSDLSLFGEVFDRIRAEYVEAPDEKKLIHAALRGMLTSLDPHSDYMEPIDYADVQEDTTGQFGGLGIEVQMEEGAIKVVSPIDDTPAAKAGILAGDFIVELDGAPVQGLSLDEAVAKMRGQVGTKIEITVVREGVDQPLDFELTRDIIATRAARLTMQGEIAVIRLARFSEQAFPGIKKSIDDAYTQLGHAPKGFVLDLRNNPGGLVDQAVYVSDAFLPQGSVVLTRGRLETESSRYDARPDALDQKIADVPLVVLINGGSASASEIVAGALQDHKRATVLGTRSFGKGSVQTIIPLGAGNGALRLTTARYYTPAGRSIQAKGISPDIEVLQDVPEELKARADTKGESALRGHLKADGEEQTGSQSYIPPDPKDDKALKMAADLLRGTVTNSAFPPTGKRAGLPK